MYRLTIYNSKLYDWDCIWVQIHAPSNPNPHPIRTLSVPAGIFVVGDFKGGIVRVNLCRASVLQLVADSINLNRSTANRRWQCRCRGPRIQPTQIPKWDSESTKESRFSVTSGHPPRVTSREARVWGQTTDHALTSWPHLQRTPISPLGNIFCPARRVPL